MKKVLVIEDELDIVAVVTIILENEGFEVVSFNDGTNYQAKLQTSHADLILLDLNLNGFNGKLICEYVKSENDLKHIPVILMSANNNIEIVKEECGADDLIRKPFDINQLIDTVNAYVYS
jgi:DNA-binding response OmpR family regulator